MRQGGWSWVQKEARRKYEGWGVEKVGGEESDGNEEKAEERGEGKRIR